MNIFRWLIFFIVNINNPRNGKTTFKKTQTQNDREIEREIEKER